jgi:hypothetical protein
MNLTRCIKEAPDFTSISFLKRPDSIMDITASIGALIVKEYPFGTKLLDLVGRLDGEPTSFKRKSELSVAMLFLFS